MIFRRLLLSIPIVAFFVVWPAVMVSAQQEVERDQPVYTVQPGDKLRISVWNEPDLQKELLIAPDGGISFPLVGEMNVIGKSTADLRQEFRDKLANYIAEPIVTVDISEILGNKIFVLGQVTRSGQYLVNPMVDVMQALSIAGGTTPFASLNDIVILRRSGSQQVAIRFKYRDVSSGNNLDSNIMLQSGDVVLVP